MVQVQFLGHAAFSLRDGQTMILIDPFITNNPVCPVQASQLNPQYILVSHFHSDHVGDTVEIAKRSGATVITTFEGAMELQSKGVKVHPMHLGGKASFPFGRVRITPAFHGSGVAGGHAAGFVVHIGGKKIYHAGDTSLYSDMKLLNGVIETGIDLALLPIGDNFTMGPEEAAVAAEWINPKVVIPMHYNTFPVLSGKAESFSALVTKPGGPRPVVLKPGEQFEL